MMRFPVILWMVFEALCVVAHGAAPGGYWKAGNPLDLPEAPMVAHPTKETKEQAERRVSAYEGASHVVPKDAEGWLELGAAYLAAGKAKEALEPLRSAVKQDPMSFEAWNRLGIGLAGLGKVNESIDAFQHVVESRPDLSEGWINLALDFIKIGRLPEAKRYLRKALTIDPKSKELWNSIANLEMAQGNQDAAFQAVDNSLKIDPDFAHALFNRGLILYSKQDLPHAIGCLRRAVRSVPGFVHARVALCMWLADSNRMEEAAWMAMETLGRDPSERNSLAILGAYDLKRDHLQEGIKETLKAQALGYDGLDSLKTLVAGMMNLGRFEEAEKAVTEVMATHPKDVNPVVCMGMIRVRQKRIEEGATFLKRALEMDPGNTRALLSFSESYRQQDRLDEAIGCARKALEQDSKCGDAWIAIGASEEKRKNAAAALAAYQKATEAEPGNYVCWRYLALSAPDYAKAFEAARKAASLSPADSATKTLPGFIQRRFHKDDEAIASYKATLKAFPENIGAGRELYGLFASLGRLKEGEAFFREMTREKPRSALAWTILGQVCDSEKKYGDAREALLKSVSLAPRNSVSWIGLAAVTLDKAGGLKVTAPGAPVDEGERSVGVEAETSLRKALEIEPANVIGFERLSVALIYQHRYAEAETAARKAIDLNGKMANAWFDLADSIYLQGNAREAIERFESCIRLDPQDFNHWSGLAVCYRELKDTEAGESEMKRLAEEFPEAAPAWFALGSILLEEHKDQEAADAYQRTLDAAQMDVKALVKLAETAARNGKEDLAKKACDLLSKLDPPLAEEMRRGVLK